MSYHSSIGAYANQQRLKWWEKLLVIGILLGGFIFLLLLVPWIGLLFWHFDKWFDAYANWVWGSR